MHFSKLALGLWRLASWEHSPQQVLDMVKRCVDLGITTFDHADIYGGYTCEEIFGNALAGQSHLRQKMQLVSKCGIKLVSPRRPQHSVRSYDTSKNHILLSVENSLKALRTEYLDVLLIHRLNPFMNAYETAEAFKILKQQGKVLHFGVSNFFPSQFDLLQSRLDFSLITNQVEISVLQIESFQNGVLDHCQQHRYQPMAWSPLAGGRLFNKEDAHTQHLRSKMQQVGSDLGGFSVEQTALAWLMAHPACIVPVLGTGKIERIKAAHKAQDILFPSEQWLEIFVVALGNELP